MKLIASLITVVALLGACTSQEFKCPIPEGSGGCSSVDAVYRGTDSLDNTDTPSAGTNLESKHSSKESDDDGLSRVIVAAGNARAPLATPSAGSALVSAPHVLRLYIAPWQDLDGDLEGGGYIYLRLDKGLWTIPQ